MFKFLFPFIFISFYLYSETEPQYCTLDVFSKYEITSPVNTSKIKRLHLFKLGSVVVGGMAVGESDLIQMENLAKYYSSNINEDKYCTWYLADTEHEISNIFVSHPIPNPFGISTSEAPSVFMKAIKTSFFEDSINFISCSEKYGYVSMGCTQMKHRGPTVLGMLLSFSGCTPEHSSQIVNGVFGLNGLSYKFRFDVIKAAYEYGNQNPQQRTKLMSLFIK